MNTPFSMDGVVSDSLNYEAWLRSKPTTVQQEILGKSKWELWHLGKITFSDLVDESGRPMTLAELKENKRQSLENRKTI